MTNPITKPITPDGLAGFDDDGHLWLGTVDWTDELRFSCGAYHDVRDRVCEICNHGWALTAEALADQAFWNLTDSMVHKTCLIRHCGLVEREELGSAIVSARIPHIGLKPIWNGYYTEGYDVRRDPWAAKPWYWTRVITDFANDAVDRDATSRVEALERLGFKPDLISIVVGWRKRVIALEVSGQGNQTLPWWDEARREFESEDVTKSFDEKHIALHCYGYAKLRDYLDRIAAVGNLRRPSRSIADANARTSRTIGLKKNPHNMLTAIDPPRSHPPRRWRCYYCGVEGLMNEVREIACTYVYPPCEHCGQTPECAPDCAGIAAALSTPGVVVIGGDNGPKTQEN